MVFGGRRGGVIAALSVVWMASTAVLPVKANAQQAQTAVDVSIPAQPLARALVVFSRQTRVQVFVPSSVSAGKQSSAVAGTLSAQAALQQLLAGTGLTYQFTGTNSVTVGGQATQSNNAPVAVDGAIQLDTIDVSGARVSASDAPYQTPGPVAHISEQTIERFRGSSPADMFRGTPGVMSGEARNGGGGIDVNIRGMQGMGRVAVTVDGAENGVSIYQGYQGASNRTFVDPDLLAGIDIQKGSDASSRGIAGTVAMRTIGADDIVKQGEKWGVRIKGGIGGNTATPVAGNQGGYRYQDIVGIATPSASGMDRPDFLRPTSGSSSVAAAVKEEGYDLFWGYAWRKQGNYFAGKHGSAAQPTNIGTTRDAFGLPVTNTMTNTGLTAYRAGEEVLNTQLETESWLAKSTFRFEDGHSVQFGYNGFRSEVGDLLASRFTGVEGQPVQQAQTAGTRLDTGTMRYRWKPDDSNLVDLKANFWITTLALRNPRRGALAPTSQSLGLPSDFRPGSDTVMWGGDVTNRSVIGSDYGSFEFTYGLSYLSEDTKPSAYSNAVEGWLNLRDATRQEAAGFGKLAYKPVEWLTLNAGLRYARAWSEDRRVASDSSGAGSSQLSSEPRQERGGASPSAGLVIEPVRGAQIYANYSNALRFPSLMESVSAFTMTVNNNVGPERASNWDTGVNLLRDSVVTSGDKAMMKFGYFNWDVSNYIAREYARFADGTSGMHIYNIDRAKFSGLELSTRYQYRGFTAELAANYYLGVDFCRTANTCENRTIYSDYATNHVPPKYSATLTVSQKLLDDALTLGGRVSHIGPRAIGHGAVTAQGAAEFIEQINWEPYWLVDVFAEYKLDETWTASARVENLFDRYYVDPLSLVNQPSPGRTFYATLTGQFGGTQAPRPLAAALFGLAKDAPRGSSWTGLYAGAHAGGGRPSMAGTVTALDGTPGGVPGTESFGSSSFDTRSMVRDRFYGGQVGFNYQFANRFLLGVEADYGQLSFQNRRDVLATEEGLAARGSLQASYADKIDWMATVRGRAGYAFDNGLLLYVTGGAAFLNQTTERTQFRLLDGATETESWSNESASLNRTGYVVGGGAEYDLGSGWSLKGEFLFARFGEKEAHFNNARAGVTPDRQVLVTPRTDDWYSDADECFVLGELPPGCYIPGSPAVYETRQGTSSQSIGRKILSKIDIPTIKIGVNYRF